MTIFSKKIVERDNTPSPFVKTEELLEGTWQIVGADVITANNPKYGANDKDALFQRSVLLEGETIRYTFIDEEGNERNYDSKGMAFYIAMKSVDLESQDRVTIKREGSQDTTRYIVEKVKAKK